ncbi:hypothetical protein [Paenibacillus sp. RC67]|uniref:hypothetical protein n=1 Tax=Paenibacillus sp. RC67 TaxID=3039392 RepID=UPI0024AE386F|nr:hypothetical protein [Paenibacillus sp. RC67]
MKLNQQRAYVVFNKLFVNNIEDSSGIFIGTNQAIGWSTYSKSNQGFGSLSNSTLTNVVSVVQDPDFIDTPIEDTRYITLTETNHSLQQCAIDFNSIHANTLSNGSAMDLGDNKQLGWRSARKVNYGFGKNLGRNHLKQVASMIVDDDAVDAPFHNEAIITENVQNVEKNIRITKKQEDKC